MLDLLLPTRCGACGRLERGRLCVDCSPVGICRLEPPDPSLRSAWRVDELSGPLGHALRRAKYLPDRHLMRDLAWHFASVAAPLGECADYIAPVPTTVFRQLSRGFSPAHMLAAELSTATRRPHISPLHLTEGRRQASLARRSRHLNLVGRVSCRRELQGSFLLVDDVVTTGATAAACARELLCSGAREVHLLTLVATRRPAGAIPDNVRQQNPLVRPYGEWEGQSRSLDHPALALTEHAYHH